MSNNQPVTDKGKLSQVQPAEHTQPKTEREKLRDMKFKDKCAYIWEYYKLYFIGGAIVIALCVSLLDTFVFNPARKTYLAVASFEGYLPWDMDGEIAEDLTTRIVPEPEEFQVYFESYYTVDDDPQLNIAMTQKLMANISVADLDILIIDKNLIGSYLNQGIFAPLDTVLPADILAAHADSLYSARGLVYSTEDKSESIVTTDFGIHLAGNAYLESFGVDTDDLLFTVISNSRRPDAIVECAREILAK